MDGTPLLARPDCRQPWVWIGVKYTMQFMPGTKTRLGNVTREPECGSGEICDNTPLGGPQPRIPEQVYETLDPKRRKIADFKLAV